MVQNCLAVARYGCSFYYNDFGFFWTGGTVFLCRGQYSERVDELDFLTNTKGHMKWKIKCNGLL